MRSIMSFIVGITFGAAVGAIVALLFAPSSGQELRGNIKTQADAQYAKMQEQYQKGMTELQTRMDKMSSDLQGMRGGSKETSTPETGESA
jgi:gas vesicle protein